MRPKMKFTLQDVPPGWISVEGGLKRWYSPEGRPASLNGVFVAGSHPDGTLAFYAYLEDGMVANGCSLEIDAGAQSGTFQAEGVTEFYSDGSFYRVANGHEEGEKASHSMAWSDWVLRAIAGVQKAAAQSRERERRRAEGRPLWQRPDGSFID